MATYGPLGDNTADKLTCAGCGEVSTNPGQFLPDGEWVCCQECKTDYAVSLSMNDLAASDGIVDAP